VNFLCSGDFGWDADISQPWCGNTARAGPDRAGRLLSTNGPAARHWQSQVMDGSFAHGPEQFRRKILTDRSFRKNIRSWPGLPVSSPRSVRPGAGLIVPQLEDNQTDKGFP
jgi:hypothetical protein